MGLPVFVYRDTDPNTTRWGDSTNGGISSRCHRLTVVNIDGPFEPDAQAPAVMIVRGNLRTIILVPAEQDAHGEWHPIPSNTQDYAGPMFGGNFAATSDSRFGEAIRALGGQSHVALPIHDRVETWRQYESLSR